MELSGQEYVDIYATSMKDRIVGRGQGRARSCRRPPRPGSAADEAEEALDAAEGVDGAGADALDGADSSERRGRGRRPATRRLRPANGPPLAMSAPGASRGPAPSRRAGDRWSSRVLARHRVLRARPPVCGAGRLDPPGRRRRPLAGVAILGCSPCGPPSQLDLGRAGSSGGSSSSSASRSPRSSRPAGRHPDVTSAGRDAARDAGRRSAVASIGSSRAGAAACAARRRRRRWRSSRPPGRVDADAVSNMLLVILVGGAVGYCVDLARVEPRRLAGPWRIEAADARARTAGPRRPRRRAPGARLHPPARRELGGEAAELGAMAGEQEQRAAHPGQRPCPPTSWTQPIGGVTVDLSAVPAGQAVEPAMADARRSGRPRPRCPAVPRRAGRRRRGRPRQRPQARRSRARTPGSSSTTPATTSSSRSGTTASASPRSGSPRRAAAAGSGCRPRSAAGSRTSGGSARYLYGPGGGTTVEMWIPKRGA